MFHKLVYAKHVVVMTLMMVSCIAVAADFDCAKAHSRTELMICSDHRLAEYDSQLGKVYRLAIKHSYEAQQSELRDAQKHWLLDVRDHCGDVECLRNAYAKRIEVVSQIKFEFLTAKKFDLLSAKDMETSFVYDQAELKTQLADFQKSLEKAGISGKLKDCQLMVHVINKEGGGNTGYGASCMLNGKRVTICSDTMIGNMALSLNSFSEPDSSPEQASSLADFVGWNCPPGG